MSTHCDCSYFRWEFHWMKMAYVRQWPVGRYKGTECRQCTMGPFFRHIVFLEFLKGLPLIVFVFHCSKHITQKIRSKTKNRRNWVTRFVTCQNLQATIICFLNLKSWFEYQITIRIQFRPTYYKKWFVS